MYAVFIYHDYEQKILNCICLFDKIKDILIWSGGLIKYNDVSKTSRVYRTYKCFFKVIEVKKQQEHMYFKKFKKFNKHSLLSICGTQRQKIF